MSDLIAQALIARHIHVLTYGHGNFHPVRLAGRECLRHPAARPTGPSMRQATGSGVWPHGRRVRVGARRRPIAYATMLGAPLKLAAPLCATFHPRAQALQADRPAVGERGSWAFGVLLRLEIAA